MMKKDSGVIFLFLLAISFFGCSPKVTTQPKPIQKENPTVTNTDKPINRFTEANISLLIPFKLHQLNLVTATKAQVDKTDMAVDFYQGVMLGIDSAAAEGLNFKVNVFDTRDETGQLATILKKESLKASHLLIGPVFPEGQKYIASFAIANKLPIVSPLAASKPSDFKNPNLIAVVNNIDQHGDKIADYIAKHYQVGNSIVVLINPKKTADEQFAAPIRNRFKQKYPSFIVQEFASASVFETKMMKEKRYTVVVCSSDASFVGPNIDKLFKLKNLKSGGFDIDLFGHPNWLKQNYNVAQLQDLNTVVSTSYKVDYKSKAVINFIKKYRDKYSFEPSEYSFKGFDIGFYFAKLIAKYGPDYLAHLTKEHYSGLHNSFSFEYDPKYGYANKDLMLVTYRNLTLNVID